VPSNPFSTRFTRPGAIPFVFSPGESLEALVGRLQAANWWGQIIGPHGSGKSTLLAALVPALEAVGRQVVSITLHQVEHRLPRLDQAAWSASSQLIVDGYEQLSWWSRRRIKSICRRHGAGLLATAHTDVGLPLIYETRPSDEMATAVVRRLLGDDGASITAEDVRSAYAAAGGNIREMLFKLFDVYQQRGPQPPIAAD
jgi:hypothetical protein